ncbi:unnamed protein product [Boreogadus saida]
MPLHEYARLGVGRRCILAKPTTAPHAIHMESPRSSKDRRLIRQRTLKERWARKWALLCRYSDLAGPSTTRSPLPLRRRGMKRRHLDLFPSLGKTGADVLTRSSLSAEMRRPGRSPARRAVAVSSASPNARPRRSVSGASLSGDREGLNPRFRHLPQVVTGAQVGTGSGSTGRRTDGSEFSLRRRLFGAATARRSLTLFSFRQGVTGSDFPPEPSPNSVKLTWKQRHEIECHAAACRNAARPAVRGVKCTLCDRSFKSRRGMSIHARTAHTLPTEKTEPGRRSSRSAAKSGCGKMRVAPEELHGVLHCESSSVCKSSLVIGYLCHHGHICIILIFHWQIRTTMLLQVVVQHSCSNDHFAASSWLETKRIS